MTEKKFIVIGGHIGDCSGKPRFVAASELVRHYGLEPMQCVLVNSSAHLRSSDFKGKIILRPVVGGDYPTALAAALKEGAR